MAVLDWQNMQTLMRVSLQERSDLGWQGLLWPIASDIQGKYGGQIMGRNPATDKLERLIDCLGF